MTTFENACESVDAAVFSSDMLCDGLQRQMLKDYLGRWIREIRRYEGQEPAAWQDVHAPQDLYTRKPQVDARPLWPDA